MDYTVISENQVCDKSSGEVLTEKELLEAGANIQGLIDGNHISANATTKSPALEGDK